MLCNIRGTWCWDAITPLRTRDTQTDTSTLWLHEKPTPASIIRYYFTQNTQQWSRAALDLAKFIPPPAWLHYCHSNRTFAWDPFVFVSSPPLKVAEGFLGVLEESSSSRAQTPPPLRSTVTGPLLSRVSSADFSRMARRLSDTCPFFTALISYTGSGREHNKHFCQQTELRLIINYLKYPQSQALEPSDHLHIPDFNRQKWNRHQPCSLCVKAELLHGHEAFYEPVVLQNNVPDSTKHILPSACRIQQFLQDKERILYSSYCQQIPLRATNNVQQLQQLTFLLSTSSN